MKILGHDSQIWNTNSGTLLAEWRQSDADSDVSFSCMACSFVGKKKHRKEHGTCLLALGSDAGEVLAVDASHWREEVEIYWMSSWGLGQHISISDDAKTIVTSGVGEKHLQVWKCDLSNGAALDLSKKHLQVWNDLSNGAVSKGPVLSMRHHHFLNARVVPMEKTVLVILSVSKSGVAYVWNLKASSEEEVIPTKVTVKASKGSDGQVTVLVAYGSADCPQFSFLDISNPSEDIVITAGDEMEKIGSKTVQENGVLAGGMHEENLEAVTLSIENKKANKKRAASDPDLADAKYLVDDGKCVTCFYSVAEPGLSDIGHREPMDESQIDEDLNEPTMGDKLASLNLQENNNKSLDKKESSQHAKPPSADSIHVLLKQALHADDRALLVNCLDTQDDKVIANSVSLLNPSDILKLLDSLISLIHSRGAVLASALPWLRSLLLQHASVIMSQESSLIALNSLYQLIESRVSTFHPALQLSSCLDLLYTAIVDDGFDENDGITPVVYEDKDESEEEDSEDAMETTDQEGSDIEPFNDVSDLEGSEDMAFDL
ncbi:hypothetical protein Acr_11g0012960 [Actinidia rufa]|uniref:Small-subunit processome Utp12 domain-containing protein n=1 Tax=Actinidia rufa TaxID=165716 RepID=A0A7J0FE59_9ERIC|nr:hypothetical protein Acr_11g0012960 [Actinidia rufa]